MKTDTYMTQLMSDVGGSEVMRLRRFRIQGTGFHPLSSSAPMIVGGSEHATVSLRDKTVSRLHARIEPDADGVRVVDLGSRNGTYVNEVRIRDVLIQRNTTVRLGGATVEIVLEDAFDDVVLETRTRLGEMLGSSAAMRRFFGQLIKFARAEAPIVLHGQTGSGKELAAEAIHQCSSRRDGPFVVVDCGSLPATLIESELFGHVKGAFSGAARDRIGAFESAHGGTLFLDEIGELPIGLQPRLLRAVEHQSIRRVGEDLRRQVDVRIVAATHRDLAAMVASGDFREDLYYRLHVFTAALPPLRDRLDDIPLLAQHFAELAVAKYPGAKPERLTDAIVDQWMERSWTGNVRELRNAVERVVILGGRGHDDDASDASCLGGQLGAALLTLPYQEAREAALRRFEHYYIQHALEVAGGNVAAAARQIGVHRGYLFRMLRKHALSSSKSPK